MNADESYRHDALRGRRALRRHPLAGYLRQFEREWRRSDWKGRRALCEAWLERRRAVKPRTEQRGVILHHNGSVYDVFADGTAYQVNQNGECVRDFKYERLASGEWVMGSFHLPAPPSLSSVLEQSYRDQNGK